MLNTLFYMTVLILIFLNAPTLQVLLGVALPEVLYSLVLVPLVYLVFRWVHNRTQFATLF